MKIYVQHLFEYLFSVLWGIYQGVKFLGYMVVLYLIFKETLTMFQQRVHHFTLPPAVHEGSYFSIPHQGCYILGIIIILIF